MSQNVVSVLSPNGRRQNVKVTQNTPILQIIEEVCHKHDLNPEEFGLKHQRVVLDSSLTFRYSGLPNHAKLELVKSPRPHSLMDTQLALQLESGERLVHSFGPTHSLWQVIQHWDALRELLQGAPPDHLPSCLYLRQEVCGEDELRRTTLHSLGLTGGKAAIRFMLRPRSNQPKSDSNQDKTQPTKAEDSQPIKALKEPDRIGQWEDAMQGIISGSEGAGLQPANQSTPQAPPPSAPSQQEDAMQGVISGSEGAGLQPSNQSTPQAPPPSASSQSQPGTCPETMEMSQDSLWTTSTGAVFSSPFSGLYLGPPNEASPGPPHQQGPGPPDHFAGSQHFIQIPHQFANFKFPEHSDEAGGVTGTSQTEVLMESQTCRRQLVVYSLDRGQGAEGVTQLEDQIPDQFFEVTVDDIRRRLHDLQKVRSSFDEQHLMTESMRREEKQRKINKYNKVVIRIQFPDRTILQGFFKPKEKVSSLMEYVKDNIRDNKEKFYLYTTPPRNILKDANLSLFDANLVPAAIVYFGSELPSKKDHHYLLPEHISHLSTVEHADVKVAYAHISSSDAGRESGATTSGGASTTGQISQSNAASGGASAAGSQSNAAKRPAASPTTSGGAAAQGKVPRWFKLGKK